MNRDHVTVLEHSGSPRAGFLRAMETWSSKLDLRALADRYGSPLYLHHRPTLEGNFHDYARLVGDPGRVRFPVKANPSPVVLRTLAGLGSGADCASAPEVRAALDAGIPVRRISYTTPAMDLRLAHWLLEEGATVVLDSAAAFEELGTRWDAGGPGRVFLRVNPGALPGYRRAEDFQRFTAHGAASSQFGIPSERIVDLLRSGGESRRASPLAVAGLHVHVGTMMDNLETFVAGLEFLHALADLVGDETGQRITTLNLGGGLGQPHLPEQDFPTIASFAETLGGRLRDGMEYHVEPGNSLVGDSFGLLTTLVSMKESRGRRWGICDVGTDQLVKHTVARWEHQIVDADGRALPAEGDDALAGPLCFAGDVLMPSTDLGDLQAGDPLLVRHAGAYCEAIASRFNGRLSPATVVLSDDGAECLERRREDAFFEPMSQSYRPPVPSVQDSGTGTAIDPARITALQSEYMHRLAEDEGYEIVGSTALGSGAYAFEIAPRAPVGFVAMPLALRIIGDASIVAVGLELGWGRKEASVWAGRLSLTATELLRQADSIPCRVVVSHLSPGRKDGIAHRGHVHFELGAEAEVRGVAQVSVEAVVSSFGNN